MAGKKQGPGLKRGDFVQIQEKGGPQWYFVALIWPAWEGLPERILGTPMSGPHYPERQALGQPRVVTVPPGSKRMDQGAASTMDEEGDPFKPNPRAGRK